MSEPCGDGAVRLALPPGCDPRAALEALRALPGARDVVVAERHALVAFDGPRPPPGLEAALAGLAHRAASLGAAPAREGALHVIRVRYDGPDLGRVAAHAGLAEAEVVRLHTAREYTVRVVGFLPGFAYLGEVDPRLAAPRLPAPRPRVPALSVGLAGARTGVYPFASPGGWNLLGTAVGFTPFDPERGPALALGDRVRFEAV